MLLMEAFHLDVKSKKPPYALLKPLTVPLPYHSLTCYLLHSFSTCAE